MGLPTNEKLICKTFSTSNQEEIYYRTIFG